MIRSLLATVGLGIVFFLAQRTDNDQWLHPYIWYILAFFLGISFLIHRLMEFGFRNKRDKFVPFYISTIVARLILSIVFIGIFFYQGLDDKPLFIIDFFALYLFYTCFEIYGLYSNLRRN
jgi:Na+/H+ antiporter NhaD/arsenite permease-like protein